MEKVKNYVLNSKNIYETFAPFYYVLKFFGFASFNLQGKFSAKKWNAIYIVLSFLFYMSWFIMILHLGEQEPEAEKSLLIKYGWHKLHVFEYGVLASVVIWNYKKRIEIEECLYLINHFDILVEKEFNWNKEINHQRQRSMVVIYFIATIVFGVVKFALSFDILYPEQKDLIHLISHLSYVIGTELTALLSFQFIFIIYFVNIRLRIFLNKFEKNFDNFIPNELDISFENFVQLYSILNSTIKSINSSYLIQVRLYIFYEYLNHHYFFFN